MSKSEQSYKSLKNINIEKFPNKLKNCAFDNEASLTLGDLHGNALKLLNLLIHHGVITGLSATDFARFVTLYKKNTSDITTEDIAWFKNDLLSKITVQNKGTLRLIGDDLADRGSNDYFTIKILQKLIQSSCGFEVLLSNHLGEFIQAHETQKIYVPLNLGHQAVSMANLNILIESGKVDKNEIRSFIEQQYFPHLKVLSYTVNTKTNTLSLFSHAPMGLQTIQGLAQKLNLVYRDATFQELTNTIDAINQKFATDYVAKGKIHTLFDKHALGDPRNINPLKHPFAYIMWNRNHDIDRPANHKGYHIKYIHGHDFKLSECNKNAHIYNLDNALGKTAAHFTGTHTFHYTHDKKGTALKMAIKPAQTTPAATQIRNTGYNFIALAMLIPASAFLFSFTKWKMISMALGTFSLALSVGIIIFASLRNQRYQASAAQAIANRNTLSTDENTAFQKGQEASNNWKAYAGSFFSYNSWRNMQAFGAGMVCTPVQHQAAAANNSPRRP